jgi:hypothetical protein
LASQRRHCKARSKRSGKRCRAWAIKGGKVCVSHGGAAGQVRAKADERLAQAAASQAVARYGLPREVDPHSALLEELWRTNGYVAWLELELGQDESRRVEGVWPQRLLEERRHFHGVARDCIRAGIEERRVTLAEQQGALLAQVIRGVLSDLGVLDRREVPSVVRKHLALVSGG